MSRLTAASLLLLLSLPFGLATPSDSELPSFHLLEATDNAAAAPYAPKTGGVSVQTNSVARVEKVLAVRLPLAVSLKTCIVLTPP
jgi:hypothetical protein